MAVSVCSFIFHPRILEMVEVLAVNYPIPDTTTVALDLTSLSITITKIDPEQFAGFEFTLPSVSLTILPSLFDSIMLPQTPKNGSSFARISNIVYEMDTLFLLGENSTDSPVVISVIASATLSVGSSVVQVSNLDPLPITLTFTRNYNDGSNISCNVWAFDSAPLNSSGIAGSLGHWSTEDCSLRGKNDTFVMCECARFAYFTILGVRKPHMYG